MVLPTAVVTFSSARDKTVNARDVSLEGLRPATSTGERPNDVQKPVPSESLFHLREVWQG